MNQLPPNSDYAMTLVMVQKLSGPLCQITESHNNRDLPHMIVVTYLNDEKMPECWTEFSFDDKGVLGFVSGDQECV